MSTDPGAPTEHIDPTTYGRDLAAALIVALPAWLNDVVFNRIDRADNLLPEQQENIIRTLTNAIRGPLTELLTSDIDAQRQSPLALLRAHIEPLTSLLVELGAKPVERDPYEQDAFPKDIFALGPMAWSDFGEEVGDAGLRWGAAKAMAHRQRHAPREPEFPSR